MARIFRKLTKFTKSEIDHAFSHAKREITTKGITILSSPKQGDLGRILIVVPRKVGTAPVRNKLRRQIKSLFFEEQLFKKERDFLVLLRPSADQANFSDLKKLLLKATSQT